MFRNSGSKHKKNIAGYVRQYTRTPAILTKIIQDLLKSELKTNDFLAAMRLSDIKVNDQRRIHRHSNKHYHELQKVEYCLNERLEIYAEAGLRFIHAFYLNHAPEDKLTAFKAKLNELLAQAKLQQDKNKDALLATFIADIATALIQICGLKEKQEVVFDDLINAEVLCNWVPLDRAMWGSNNTLITLTDVAFEVGQNFTAAQIEVPAAYYTIDLCHEWFGIFLPNDHARYPTWFVEVGIAKWESNFWEMFLFDIFKATIPLETSLTEDEVAFFTKEMFVSIIRQKLFDYRVPNDALLEKLPGLENHAIDKIRQHAEGIALHALFKFLPSSPSTNRRYPGLSNYYHHVFLVLDEKGERVLEHARYRSSVMVPYMMPKALHPYHTQLSAEQFLEHMLVLNPHRDDVRAWFGSLLSPLLSPNMLSCESPVLNTKRAVITNMLASGTKNIRSALLREMKLDLIESNTPVNEFRAGKKLSRLAVTDNKSLIEPVLKLIHAWARQPKQLRHAGMAQLIEVVSEDWQTLKDKPLHVEINNDQENDRNTHFTIQLALFYIQCHQTSSAIHRSSDYSAILRSAAEELLLPRLGYYTLNGCRSGKDRRGVSLLFQGGLLCYLSQKRTLPSTLNFGVSVKLLNEMIGSLFISGHNQMLARNNARGCLGLKSLKSVMPADLVKLIATKAPGIFEHNRASANFNRPSFGFGSMLSRTSASTPTPVSSDNTTAKIKQWAIRSGMDDEQIDDMLKNNDEEVLVRGPFEEDVSDFDVLPEIDQANENSQKQAVVVARVLEACAHYQSPRGDVELDADQSFGMEYEANEKWNLNAVATERKKRWYERLKINSKPKLSRKNSVTHDQDQLVSIVKARDWSKLDKFLEMKKLSINDFDNDHTLLSYFLHHWYQSASNERLNFDDLMKALKAFQRVGASFSKAKNFTDVPLDYLHCIIKDYDLFPGKMPQFAQLIELIKAEINDRNQTNESFVLALFDRIILPQLKKCRHERDVLAPLQDEHDQASEMIKKTLAFLLVLKSYGMDLGTPNSKPTLLNHFLDYIKHTIQDDYNVNRRADNTASFQADLNHLSDVLTLIAEMMKLSLINIFQDSNRDKCSFDYVAYIWSISVDQQIKDKCAVIFRLSFIIADENDSQVDAKAYQQLQVTREEYLDSCPGFEETLALREGLLPVLLEAIEDQYFSYTFLNKLRERVSASVYEDLTRCLRHRPFSRLSGPVCHRFDLEHRSYMAISGMVEVEFKSGFNLSKFINEDSVICINNYRTYPELNIKLAFILAANLKLEERSEKGKAQDTLTVEKWFANLNDLFSLLLTANDSAKAVEYWNVFLRLIERDFSRSELGRIRISANANNLEKIVTCVRRLVPLSISRDAKWTLLTTPQADDDALFNMLRRHQKCEELDEIFQRFHRAFDLRFGTQGDVMAQVQNAAMSVNYIDELRRLIKNFPSSRIAASDLAQGQHTLLTCLIENHYQTVCGDFGTLIDLIEARRSSVNVANGDGRTPLELLLNKVLRLNTPSHWKNVLKLIAKDANVCMPEARDANDYIRNPPVLIRVCQHFLKGQHEENEKLFAKIIFALLSRDESNGKAVQKLLVAYFKSISEYEISKLVKPLISSLSHRSQDSEAYGRMIVSIIIDANAPAVIKRFFEYRLEHLLTKFKPQMCRRWGFAQQDILDQAIANRIMVFFSRETLAFFTGPDAPTRHLQPRVLPAVSLLYLVLREYSPSNVLDQYQRHYFKVSTDLANQFETNNIDLEILTQVYDALRAYSSHLTLHDVIRALEGLLNCEKYSIYNRVKFEEVLAAIIKPGLEYAQRLGNDNANDHLRFGTRRLSNLDEDDGLSPANEEQALDTNQQLAQTMVDNLAELQSTLFHVTVAGLRPGEMIDAFEAEPKEYNIFTYIRDKYPPDQLNELFDRKYSQRVAKLCKLDLAKIIAELKDAIDKNRLLDVITALDAIIMQVLTQKKLRYSQILTLLTCFKCMTDNDNGSAVRDILAQALTGQGKSLIICLLAIYSYYKYGKVQTTHIISANNNLAARDSDLFTNLFVALGIPHSTGRIYPETAVDKKVEKPYITYTTMRHVVTWHFFRYYQVLLGNPLVPLPPALALIDEVDLELYQTNGALHIQLKTLLQGMDAVIVATWRVITELSYLSTADKIVEITKEVSLMQDDFQQYVLEIIPSLIESAKLAVKKEKRKFYNVDGNDVVLTNPKTGQVMRNVRVNATLLQFAALKEGLPLPPTYLRTATLSYQEILKTYRLMIGLSGSLGTDEERQSILAWRGNPKHRMVTFNVPLYHARESKFVEYRPTIFATEGEWYAQFARIADRESREGVPILIVVDSEAKVQGIYDLLISLYGRTIYDTFKITGLRKDHNTNETNINVIVSKSGMLCGDADDNNKIGAITVATRLGARGHDFQVHGHTDVMRKKGGGVLSNWCEDANEEKQIWGRRARQDCNGWGKLILSRPEIESYLEKIKTDYNISYDGELPWQDSKAVVVILRGLRKRVALAQIEERAVKTHLAFIFHHINVAFFNAVANHKLKGVSFENKWSIFLTRLCNSHLLTEDYNPANAEKLSVVKKMFKHELADYSSNYEQSMLAIYLLVRHFPELRFDLSPASSLACINRNAVTLQRINSGNTVVDVEPISAASSSSSSTSTTNPDRPVASASIFTRPVSSPSRSSPPSSAPPKPPIPRTSGRVIPGQMFRATAGAPPVPAAAVAVAAPAQRAPQPAARIVIPSSARKLPGFDPAMRRLGEKK